MVLEKFGEKLKLMELPDPVPGYGEVILDVETCGVCQSDLKVTSGMHPNCDKIQFPFIPGHEICGRVSVVGAGVSGWEKGDRALVSIYMGCTTCDNCRAGLEQLCVGDCRIVGFSANGGYADKLRIQARNLVRISDKLPAPQAAIITDAVATSHRAAFDAAEIKGSERALVIGLGGLGVHLAQILKACGLDVTVCDVNAEKLAITKELNLEKAFCGPVEELPAVEKFDTIFDVTGKIYNYDGILKHLKHRGKFIMVGYSVTANSNFLSAIAHVGELRIIGTRGYTVKNLKGSVDLVERGLVKPVVGAVKPLEEANEVLQMLREGFGLCGRLVLKP